MCCARSQCRRAYTCDPTHTMHAINLTLRMQIACTCIRLACNGNAKAHIGIAIPLLYHTQLAHTLDRCAGHAAAGLPGGGRGRYRVVGEAVRRNRAAAGVRAVRLLSPTPQSEPFATLRRHIVGRKRARKTCDAKRSGGRCQIAGGGMGNHTTPTSH